MCGPYRVGSRRRGIERWEERPGQRALSQFSFVRMLHLHLVSHGYTSLRGRPGGWAHNHEQSVLGSRIHLSGIYRTNGEPSTVWRNRPTRSTDTSPDDLVMLLTAHCVEDRRYLLFTEPLTLHTQPSSPFPFIACTITFESPICSSSLKVRSLSSADGQEPWPSMRESFFAKPEVTIKSS